jgi:hypothetical protein
LPSHILQFCHLCHIGKITPVLFISDPSIEARAWKSSILTTIGKQISFRGKNPKNGIKIGDEDDDESDSSPAQKISQKDKDNYFITTMLKIHESVDISLSKSPSEREEKETGFNKLEPHKQNLILNASAIPPFDSPASEPTEFYSTFLKKKTQFKAKEMLLYQLSINNIAFNPNTHFVSCLWNCEFLWILPDSPSGNSIFFCPEPRP